MKILTNKSYEELVVKEQKANSKIKSLEKQVENLKKQMAGDRLTGEHCEKCQHGYKVWNRFLGYYSYGCLLDVKCKDFIEVV